MDRLYPSKTQMSVSDLRNDLRKEYGNTCVEILPIFERAYISKPCQQFLLVQLQSEDSRAFALSLYHKWKAMEDTLRIEFVEKWFARSYFLQHAHLYSKIANQSMITVHHNNKQKCGSFNARHCTCDIRRVIHFPAFESEMKLNANEVKHDQKCVQNCCCSVFHRTQNPKTQVFIIYVFFL